MPSHEHTNSPEQLIKTVPIEQAVDIVPDATPYEPGTYAVNNGLVEFRSPDGQPYNQVALATQDMLSRLDEGGARAVDAPVTYGNGLRGTVETTAVDRLMLNRLAIDRGLQNRITYGEDGAEYPTTHPFDPSDYIQISGRIRVDGVRTPDNVINAPEVDQVGGYTVEHNSATGAELMTWVTADGEIQTAPYSAHKETVLREMGFTQRGDIANPLVNPQAWDPTQRNLGGETLTDQLHRLVVEQRDTEQTLAA